MSKLVALIGFCAAGKDTIKDILSNDHKYSVCINHTTRPIRPSELDGREYNFINKDTFNTMRESKEFAGVPREYTTLVNGIEDTWYYGTSKTELVVDKNKVIVLDLQGYLNLKKEVRDNMLGFFISVDEETRRTRCIKRGDFNREEWCRRAKDDRKIINELSSVIKKDKNLYIVNYSEAQDCARYINKKVNSLT